MATYGSDDEQVEALKQWWRDNGSSLLTGILVVLALLFGFRTWENSQISNNSAASDLYQQILDLSLSGMTQAVSAENVAAAERLTNQLKTEFDGSIYSRYAALAMAAFHVQQQQPERAAAELQWILDNPDLGFMKSVDEELLLTARLRLARVMIAQGDAQAALDLLRAVDPGSFAGSYAEVEGDALVSLGQPDEAREAYQRALAANLGTNPSLLQLKLQDLGVSPQEQL